jgi:hypothetical protein
MALRWNAEIDTCCATRSAAAKIARAGAQSGSLTTIGTPLSLPLQLLIGIAALCAAFALLCLLWPAFRRDVAGILHTRTLLRSA